jgi:hypothetical protein
MKVVPGEQPLPSWRCSPMNTPVKTSPSACSSSFTRLPVRAVTPGSLDKTAWALRAGPLHGEMDALYPRGLLEFVDLGLKIGFFRWILPVSSTTWDADGILAAPDLFGTFPSGARQPRPSSNR